MVWCTECHVHFSHKSHKRDKLCHQLYDFIQGVSILYVTETMKNEMLNVYYSYLLKICIKITMINVMDDKSVTKPIWCVTSNKVCDVTFLWQLLLSSCYCCLSPVILTSPSNFYIKTIPKISISNSSYHDSYYLNINCTLPHSIDQIKILFC